MAFAGSDELHINAVVAALSCPQGKIPAARLDQTMISRRGFIAGLLSFPVLAKLEPVARAILPRLPGRLGTTARELLEAGYVWCPYIPVVYTETILEPNGDRIREAYAKSALRMDYYGKVKILDDRDDNR